MYPRIIVTKNVEVDNEDGENPITALASYVISDISASRAKSEASSSVTMECLEKIGGYDGFAQVRGSADRNTTRGVALVSHKIDDNPISMIDAEGVAAYITLNQFNYWSKDRPGKLTIQSRNGVIYTAAKRGGVVADSRPVVLGISIPWPGTTAGKDLELSESADIEKDKQDPNGDGVIADDEIIGMFDPYAAAAGQSIGAANVDPAKANTEMEDGANNAQNIQNTVAPVSSPTPDPPSTTPSLSYSLVSSDGSYSAEAGTGHEANFTTNSAYQSVYWYVKSPSDTSYYGTNVETDYGDSSTTTTAQLSYSFPSGVSGDYVITAYVYDNDSSVYETSYTVSVSLPSSSTPPPTTTSTPSPGLSAADGSTNPVVHPGGTHEAELVTSEPYYYVRWYVKAPGDTSSLGTLMETDEGWQSGGTETEASFSYTFPDNAAGVYTITAVSQRYSNLSEGSTRSYTVTVE